MSTNSAAATSSNSSRVKSLAITAICLVLVYVFTAVVNIRLPFAPNGGLVHLGNVPLFVAAILFGKRTGMIAGGIGMGLFDLLSGWTLWAPFTLVIVGCMGFVVGAITEKRKNMGFIVLALIAACAIKIVGYYFAEVVIYGNWVVPFTSIPGNLIQIGVAAVITLIIIKPLQAAAEHTILKKA
ncbi:MAG: ECF transporter S component [Evtepia sp.]|nr:ECF transporter S component [Evtepia sp.]